MEDYEYKYVHKMAQFLITLNFKKKCWRDLVPKKVKISNFLSNLYSKSLRECKKPEFTYGHKVRILNMTYTSGRVISRRLSEKFLKMLQFPENLQHTQ